jgi:hypothetical protein
MENIKREIEFLGTKYWFVPIQNWLSNNKNRGRSFTNQRFCLKYYMIRNCAAIGKYGQLLLPIENNIDHKLIFEESFVYDHDDHGRWSLLHNNFSVNSDFIEIEEAVPIYHVWSNNFYHWTLECLPKILILEDQGYTGKYIVFNSAFIIESLKLFNISENRICYSDKNYIVKNMIVPPIYSGYDLAKDKYTLILGYLRSKILDAVDVLQGNNRIYIKRTTGRVVLNEDKVLDILAKYYFDVIVPEDYSFKDQFRMMTNVDFSITAHGANSTLILAQKTHSVFIEFFSSAYTAYHTAGITKILSLDYIPLVESRDRPIILDKNETGQYCNITVPITLFEILISNIMKRFTK